MKLLFENWRKLLNEISFEDAKKRLETKALTKWIKGMAFDEETRTMTLTPDQVEVAKNELAILVLEFIPEDLTDNQKGTTLEWIISVGINDPRMKPRFYNETIATVAPGDHSIPALSSAVYRNDIERYWQTHGYSEQKDIFSIETWGALSWAADKAKKKYDDAMAGKEYLDADKGIEVFRDDDEWRIYALHNKGAACHYGKRTNWCTAAPGLSYFEDYYDEEDPLFYFEDKENGKRFQFHFGSDQFMDAGDNQVEDEERDFFIDLLAKTGAAKKYSIVQYWVTKNEVAQIIYDDNTTSEELFAIAKEYSGQGEREIIEMIIDSDLATEEILQYLILSGDEAGEEAIGDEKITDEWLNSLASAEDGHLRYLAALAVDHHNRGDVLTPETADKLSEDPLAHIRKKIAFHPAASPETLAKMASRLMKGEEKESRPTFLSNLLRNNNLPPNLIAPLIEWSKSTGHGGDVRPRGFKDTLAPMAMEHAAKNPNTPSEVLGEIGNVFLLDSDVETGYQSAILGALANNEKTPEDTLLKLSKSKNQFHKQTAKRTLQRVRVAEKIAAATAPVRERTEKIADQTGMDSLRENFKRFLK